MIFGDPHRLAIWTEYIPEWSGGYKNGLFYLVINSNMYPEKIRVSTLSVDLFEIIDSDCALVSQPRNDQIFELPTKEAFNKLFNLAYPESSADDEYPEQNFNYCITSSNISDSGCCFFALSNETSVRIIGGKTERLIRDEIEDRNYWETIKQPMIEDVIISKNEIETIIKEVKEYSQYILGEKS